MQKQSDNESVSTVEEDEWEECYYIGEFSDHSSNAYAEYHNAVYYMTFGGGPSGGYLVNEDKNGNLQLYLAEQNWGTPWVITPLPNHLIELKIVDTIKYVRTVQKEA
jgi:hypothetical protein